MRRAVLLAGLWLSAAAHAAQPALVGLFDADPDDAGLAVLLRDSIERELQRDRPVVALEDVPRFPAADARTYLADCPPGDTLGCTWVVAARAEVRFGVTGVVGRDADGTFVELAIIDVEDARVALSYLVVWDGDDGAIATALRHVLGVVEEELAAQAIQREEAGSAEDLALLERELAARALAGLEAEQGELARLALEGPLEAPRVTREDLDAWSASDATPPWKPLGLGPVEYMRFRNAGVPLTLWRRRRLGRARSVVVRLFGMAGSGLGPQAYDGRYVYNNQNLATEELWAWQSARHGATLGGGLEVGFGLHRFVEVSVGIEGRQGEFSWLFHEERTGDPIWQEPRATTVSARSGQLTAQVVVSPLPTCPVRPIGLVGVGYWWGRRLDAFVEQQNYPVFDAPWVLTTRVGLGVEARLTEVVDVFARVPLAIPSAGTPLAQVHTGTPGTLQSSNPPSGLQGLGITVQLGVQLRLGPIGGIR